MYNNLDKSNIFIFGDFNFPSVKWGITSCEFPKYLSTSLEAFKNFIDESFLSQYVHDYTRNSNILDLFLTDNPNFVQLIKVDTIPYSDHNLVKIFTTYFSLKETVSCNRVEDHHDFSSLNLNSADWSSVNNDFSCLDWDKIVSCPLNDFPDVFRNTVFEILSKHCKINISKQNTVFYDKKIKSLNKKIYKFKNQMKYSNCCQSRRKKLSLAIIKLIDSKKQVFFSNILSRETKATQKIKSDKKYFFKYVNRYRKTLSHSPKLLIDDNGNAVSDPQRIADLFQDQFKSVFSTPLESQLNNYSLISEKI